MDLCCHCSCFTTTTALHTSMSASNAFRSHLMQSFTSAAKSQTRPPVALIPWLEDNSSENREGNCCSNDNTTRVSQTRALEKPWSRLTTTTSLLPSSPSDRKQLNPRHRGHHQQRQQHIQYQRQESLALQGPSATSSLIKVSSAENLDESGVGIRCNGSNSETTRKSNLTPTPCSSFREKQHSHETVLAHELQRLIHTRRTTNHFASSFSSVSTTREEENIEADSSFWKEALERAVACARRAPNQRQTSDTNTGPPFLFHRMVSPSKAIKKLSEIVYRVTMLRLKSSSKTRNRDWMKSIAKTKQQKWNSIPAFLAVTLRSSNICTTVATLTTSNSNSNSSSSSTDLAARHGGEDTGNAMYEPFPFVPLEAERELEDVSWNLCCTVDNGLWQKVLDLLFLLPLYFLLL